MTVIHNLGYPRIGAQRELKTALEAYWRGQLDQTGLLKVGEQLRAEHWRQQQQAGLDLIPVGDFAWYDQVLNTSTLLGVVPSRFNWLDEQVDLDTYFRMARGHSENGNAISACEMTKWFDSNYHYLVPEFEAEQTFRLASEHLFEEIAQAQALGHTVKPVLLGPLSYLWLGKCQHQKQDKLALLERLIPVYNQILARLKAMKIEWVQLDEPALVLTLPQAWKNAFESTYPRLAISGVKILLATYFGPLGDNLNLTCRLPVQGLHIDLVRGAEQLAAVLDQLPNYKVLSLGVVDGRNIWRNPLENTLALLTKLQRRRVDELWLAPSCSLLHVPLDLELETAFDPEFKSWLAFARQKLDELAVLKTALDQGQSAAEPRLTQSHAAHNSRKHSARIHLKSVQSRIEQIDVSMTQRHRPYAERAPLQRQRLALPLYPTTTIGSFPQTREIRRSRHAFKQGELSEADYRKQIRAEIAQVIQQQEDLGLDVLVHGEAERNDMVEYFAGLLQGFAFSEFGWVQSFGSRCVKPPIIYGDVQRNAPMTLEWIEYAQSLTTKPVKGMLTGPVTLLNWSFVRDDQPRATTCQQIALALRDEVRDLETAGIKVIQIDEAALREGLPLRQHDWPNYLAWSTQAFQLAAAGVRDDTQIHTHMCYSRFSDIADAIAAMDADVITIESSRTEMKLLETLELSGYPNEIGPGIYDIHSPCVPAVAQIIERLRKAASHFPAERLWVNPDCGLKTREWPEVRRALQNMIAASHELRRLSMGT